MGKLVAGVLAAGMVIVPAGTASALPKATAKPAASVTAAGTGESRLFVDVNPDRGRGFWNIKVQRWNGKKWTTKKNYRTQGATEYPDDYEAASGTYRVVVKPKYGHKGTTSAPVVLPVATAPASAPAVTTTPTTRAPVVTTPAPPQSSFNRDYAIKTAGYILDDIREIDVHAGRHCRYRIKAEHAVQFVWISIERRFPARR